MRRLPPLRAGEPLWYPPLLLCSFALTAYAGTRLLGGGDPLGVVLWVVGAALLHDLVLLPLYTAADRAVGALPPPRRRSGADDAAPDAARPRAPYRPGINHLRIPALLSGLLLLVWWPLVSGPPARFERSTGLSADGFTERWLLMTAALFAVSAGWALLSALRRRARR
ncbi:hypothetical protein [Streptomyces xinghaiensis]|uniref:hypothetical protein n=1 Tax=Streptomyces xinghaiensis TaxID=1038928 RepID=UPI002E116657|nr:hypothetical protein OG463_28515 [Streptomyces xinghaiensis]